MSPRERDAVREAVRKAVFKHERRAVAAISEGFCPGGPKHGRFTPPPPGIIPTAPIASPAHGYCATCHAYYSLSPRVSDPSLLAVGAYHYPHGTGRPGAS